MDGGSSPDKWVNKRIDNSENYAKRLHHTMKQQAARRAGGSACKTERRFKNVQKSDMYAREEEGSLLCLSVCLRQAAAMNQHMDT